ncbi:unnamed protein product [Meganyctiphanes norvegica]|uniref:Uncharacterized protein n=1 Tax=Meganyctiphanes norvegica TaxID=48144 RepID=A0AAV2PLE2_MEGNR
MANIIVLLSLLGVAVGNILTHKYPVECAPPFNKTDDATTTVGYVTLSPLERCCTCTHECKELGGFCALRWAMDIYPHCCDFTPAIPCKDYSCTCCIKCADDKCSPCVETGGECRKECRVREQEDTVNKCEYHNGGEDGCKCCKNCEATDECTGAEGICRPNADDCPFGTYASTGCCGGCYCCKPALQVIPDTNCALKDSYCSETPECENGYYSCFGECSKTIYNSGLSKTVFGYCCIRK